MTNPTNDPTRPGSYANTPEFFGGRDGARYCVVAIHTRFEAVEWFVFDAEQEDDVTGNAAVIRQEPTRAEAVAGLGPNNPTHVLADGCGWLPWDEAIERAKAGTLGWVHQVRFEDNPDGFSWAKSWKVWDADAGVHRTVRIGAGAYGDMTLWYDGKTETHLAGGYVPGRGPMPRY